MCIRENVVHIIISNIYEIILVLSFVDILQNLRNSIRNCVFNRIQKRRLLTFQLYFFIFVISELSTG